MPLCPLPLRGMHFDNASGIVDLDVTLEALPLTGGRSAGRLARPATSPRARGPRRDGQHDHQQRASDDEGRGLVSIWMLGMLNAGPQTVVMVPYAGRRESGPVVKSDYFGEVPADRLKVTPQAILFRRRQLPLEDRHLATTGP